MDERLKKLLKIVVEEHISTAEPVGSQHLVEHYRLDVSPATVRNWLSELEEEGLVTQPHTSGGRVPTEKGFRTYIQLFVQPKPPAKRERVVLEKALNKTQDENRRVKSLAKALADLSGDAMIIGLNEMDAFYVGLAQLFAQPEFKNWKRAVSLTEALDHLDETLHALSRQAFDEPTILLGEDCPFGSTCGAILASTDGGMIGILGPLRMDYQQGLSLLSSALDLFD